LPQFEALLLEVTEIQARRSAPAVAMATFLESGLAAAITASGEVTLFGLPENTITTI
jgi:hypothetical protein